MADLFLLWLGELSLTVMALTDPQRKLATEPITFFGENTEDEEENLEQRVAVPR